MYMYIIREHWDYESSTYIMVLPTLADACMILWRMSATGELDGDGYSILVVQPWCAPHTVATWTNTKR